MVLKWKHKDAAEKAVDISQILGEPSALDESRGGMMLWRKTPRISWRSRVGPYLEIWVRDESIRHPFPAPHRDFLYSSMKIDVPKEMVGRFAFVTGSIIADTLKGEVTARCQMLVKNAVTLGFVQDMVGIFLQRPESHILFKKELKAEYSMRIKGNITPDWWIDVFHELGMKDNTHHPLHGGICPCPVHAHPTRPRNYANALMMGDG